MPLFCSISFYVNVGVAAINIALNFLLIPLIGIVGAAIASAAAFVARDVVFTAALYRWEGVHPFSRSMLVPLSGGLALGAVGFVGLFTFFSVRILTVVPAGIASLLLYVPLCVVLGALEPEDEQMLSLVEDRIGREIPYLRRVAARLRGIGRLSSG